MLHVPNDDEISPSDYDYPYGEIIRELQEGEVPADDVAKFVRWKTGGSSDQESTSTAAVTTSFLRDECDLDPSRYERADASKYAKSDAQRAVERLLGDILADHENVELVGRNSGWAWVSDAEKRRREARETLKSEMLEEARISAVKALGEADDVDEWSVKVENQTLKISAGVLDFRLGVRVSERFDIGRMLTYSRRATALDPAPSPANVGEAVLEKLRTKRRLDELAEPAPENDWSVDAYLGDARE